MRGLDSGGPRSSKFSKDGGRGAVLLLPVRMIILVAYPLFAVRFVCGCALSRLLWLDAAVLVERLL